MTKNNLVPRSSGRSDGSEREPFKAGGGLVDVGSLVMKALRHSKQRLFSLRPLHPHHSRGRAERHIFKGLSSSCLGICLLKATFSPPREENAIPLDDSPEGSSLGASPEVSDGQNNTILGTSAT